MSSFNSIPLPPPLISFFTTKHNLKKLRCLNLTAVKNHNTNLTENDESSCIFSLQNSKEIALDETELDTYFKINSIKKKKIDQESKTESKEANVSLYSLFVNKNKYATTFVIIKKFQLENIFPKHLKDIFQDMTGHINMKEEFKALLFNYDFLQSIKTIIPNKEEIKSILNKINDMPQKTVDSMAFIDQMYIAIAQWPEFNSLINTLSEIIETKNDLDDKYTSCNAITSLLDMILANDRLKYFIGIVLKINNYLNKSTGNRLIKGFKFQSLENVLDLKLNGKPFFYLIGNYYMTKYPTESIISKADIDQINFYLEYLSKANIAHKEIDHTRQYAELINEINLIIPRNDFKNIIINEFCKEIVERIKEFKESREKEKDLQCRICHYFLLEEIIGQEKDSINQSLVEIFKIVLKIEGKLKAYLDSKNKPINCMLTSQNDFRSYLTTSTDSNQSSSNNTWYITDPCNKENLFKQDMMNSNKKDDKRSASTMKDSLAIAYNETKATQVKTTMMNKQNINNLNNGNNVTITTLTRKYGL